MNNLLTVVIESERLKLIPISEKYVHEIFNEFTDKIAIFMYPKSPDKIEETLSFINSSVAKIKSGEELQLVILDRKTGEFLGCCGINKLSTSTPEPGIWIKKNAHGKKYGKEAVSALVEWLNENYKYKYIKYPVDKSNISSIKIVESLGGIPSEEYKKTNLKGKVLDEVEYRIYPEK